jgi:hypothetical protein
LHLSSAESLKNPIFATGAGLIVKGYEILKEQGGFHFEEDTPIFTELKQEIVQEEVVEEEISVLDQFENQLKEESVQLEESPYVSETSRTSFSNEKKKGSSWINSMAQKVNDWFSDDSINNDDDFKQN